MANELTFIEQAEQKFQHSAMNENATHDANNLSNGNIVYKRDTGMAHKIVSVSLANGIEHYQLVCSETRTNIFYQNLR